MDFVLVASFSHLIFNKVSKSNIMIYLTPLEVSVTGKILSNTAQGISAVTAWFWPCFAGLSRFY